MHKMRVAIVGCGIISEWYLNSLTKTYSEYCEVAALVDINKAAAEQRAEQFSISTVMSLDELWASKDIDLVVNLTIPAAHCEITCKALESGKHVYTEKPLAVTMEEALKIKETSERTGKTVGCATDIYLGMPGQTALKAVESGLIGKIFGAHCVCVHELHGNEHWHPNPATFYKAGAGPMMDMGGYYLNPLIAMCGPVKTVYCQQSLNFPKRLITCGPRKGQVIDVEVPTHVIGTLTFENGAIVTIMNSLDVWNTKQPYMEIYGTEGTMILPDPNRFEGDVLISRMQYGPDKWSAMPALVEYKDAARGAGLTDMIKAISENRIPRCSMDIGLHLVEIFQAFDESAATHKVVELKTTCQQPKALWQE